MDKEVVSEHAEELKELEIVKIPSIKAFFEWN